MNIQRGEWIPITILICLFVLVKPSTSSSNSNESAKRNAKGMIFKNIVKELTDDKVSIESHPPQSKPNHASVNNDWPKVIGLLCENLEKNLNQLSQETMKNLIGHMEKHLKQSEYAKVPNNPKFCRLEKAIVSLEILNSKAFTEYKMKWRLKSHMRFEGFLEKEFQRIEELWLQNAVICALYMVDESEDLRVLFNNLSKHENIPSALKRISEEYRRTSNYQGYELEQRFKILQLAMRYKGKIMNESFESLESIQYGPCWQDMVKTLITKTYWGTMDVEGLENRLSECVSRLKEIDYRLRKRAKQLVVEINAEIAFYYKCLLEYNQKGTFAGKKIHVDEMISVVEAPIKKKSFIICALHIANESPALLNLLKPYLDKGFISGLDSIVEEFRKTSGYEGEDLDWSIFVLEEAFTTDIARLNPDSDSGSNFHPSSDTYSSFEPDPCLGSNPELSRIVCLSSDSKEYASLYLNSD